MELPVLLRPHNLYHLLGVDSFSGIQQIKSGFHQVALKYHPDRKSSEQDSTDQFVLCTEAYKILRVQEKRLAYNSWLMAKEKTRKKVYSCETMGQKPFEHFVQQGRKGFKEFLKTVPRVSN